MLRVSFTRVLVLAAAIVLAVGLAVRLSGAQQPREILDEAIADFMGGRVDESVKQFDQLVKVAPGLAPELWQRGIALYYAGRYDDCRRQFELHRIVNPNDVENAAWHFLCVAHAESPARARAALLPVGPDSRVPMRQVYDMFRGAVTPASVLQAAGAQAQGQFFANLYVGLYFDALGDRSRAMQHLTAAAAGRYANAGGYMHGVALVHLKMRQQR